MAEDYQVQASDCMSSIAYTHGFFWETLWNLPENADLKELRKDPNVLMTDDIVHIPGLTIKQESRPTDAKHKFQLKGVPEVLRMQLLDVDQKPRANLDYIITIEGISHRGKTDGNGELRESISPSARNGTLTFTEPMPVDPNGKPAIGKPKTQLMQLQLGDLDPISEVSGLQARLYNLGLYGGPMNGTLDRATKGAIGAFQKQQGLPVTGVPDDTTRAQLQKIHGH